MWDGEGGGVMSFQVENPTYNWILVSLICLVFHGPYSLKHLRVVVRVKSVALSFKMTGAMLWIPRLLRVKAWPTERYKKNYEPKTMIRVYFVLLIILVPSNLAFKIWTMMTRCYLSTFRFCSNCAISLNLVLLYYPFS